MAVEIALPTLTTILLTAAIDSINPCAIGVLILLVSTLIVTKRKTQMLKIGMLYIGAIFVTYFLFGLGLTAFMANIPLIVSEYISIRPDGVDSGAACGLSRNSAKGVCANSSPRTGKSIQLRCRNSSKSGRSMPSARVDSANSS